MSVNTCGGFKCTCLILGTFMYKKTLTKKAPPTSYWNVPTLNGISHYCPKQGKKCTSKPEICLLKKKKKAYLYLSFYFLKQS